MGNDCKTNWWTRDDLDYRDGHLCLGGTDLLAIARKLGTPTFVYSAARARANLSRLHDALDAQGLEFRICYAMKSNRHVPLLEFLAGTSLCGIDACSPAEVQRAMQTGFAAGDIVFTGTSVSDRDLDFLATQPEVAVNCDALSTIRRLGERCPGRSIGLRINLQSGIGYHDGLVYAGDQPSKFGIYADRFDEALTLAARYRMPVRTLHFHSGCGYLAQHMDEFERLLLCCIPFLDACEEVNTLDVGGGLGIPLLADDLPLDLARWTGLLADFAKPRGLRIVLEPGDYIVKDSGVLLAQVNTVEEKGGQLFVGVDAGLNLSNIAAHYHLPQVVVPLQQPATQERIRTNVAGNINEAVDMFASAQLLPPLAEQEFVALLNGGGYSAASSSNHCMRGEFRELLLAAD